ncbi:hypothetical protein PMAYCL1PPCAC_13755, partial [Pristionchus mayeri]
QCMKCLLHGESQSHSSHDCPRSKCECRKCHLIDSRRSVANKLVRLGRKQKIEYSLSDRDCRYTCARCRNHGILVIKKHHTPCPYSLCPCEPCTLNGERKRIDAELNEIMREER